MHRDFQGIIGGESNIQIYSDISYRQNATRFIWK